MHTEAKKMKAKVSHCPSFLGLTPDYENWKNMCGFKFALSDCFISASTNVLVCSKTANSAY